MYCYHCGYELDEKKVEAKGLSLANVGEVGDETTISYVCPRCGHLITEGAEEKDLKSLSMAAHAQVQRGANHFAFGMGWACLGIILLTLGILFFVLAHKPAQQYQLVTTCAEFYVSMAMIFISVVLLVLGGIYIVLGVLTSHKYKALLKDLNNRTFVQ